MSAILHLFSVTLQIILKKSAVQGFVDKLGGNVPLNTLSAGCKFFATESRVTPQHEPILRIPPNVTFFALLSGRLNSTF
jgi:hypothetical protein